MIIETDVSRIELDERGFLRITLIDTGKEFDEAEAARQIAAAHELTNGEKYKVLVDVSKSTITPNAEAKKIIADVPQKIKEAVIVTSLANRIISNIYMKLINKRYPVKLFKNEDAAIEWLAKEE